MLDITNLTDRELQVLHALTGMLHAYFDVDLYDELEEFRQLRKLQPLDLFLGTTNIFELPPITEEPTND